MKMAEISCLLSVATCPLTSNFTSSSEMVILSVSRNAYEVKIIPAINPITIAIIGTQYPSHVSTHSSAPLKGTNGNLINHSAIMGENQQRMPPKTGGLIIRFVFSPFSNQRTVLSFNVYHLF